MNAVVHPIQIADLAYLPVPASDIAPVIADPHTWTTYFPGLVLTLTENRGDCGVRWRAEGRVEGTSEVWLEAAPDGTFVHYFLHGSPTGKDSSDKLTTFYRLQGKKLITSLRHRLDGDRPAGEDPQQWRQEHPLSRETDTE